MKSRTGGVARVEDDHACVPGVSCGETPALSPRAAAPYARIVPPNVDMELMTPGVSLRDLMRLQQRRGGGARRSDPNEASRAEARRFEQERARQEEQRRHLEFDRLRQR